MKPQENPYKQQVIANLPRFYSLYDRNPVSKTRGIGDRLYWAWKLKDFPNATFQGGVHALAALSQLDIGVSRPLVSDLLKDLFFGISLVTRKNGSLEEAFPHESSYCVTALVAYDALSAIEILNPSEKNQILDVIAPLISFLKKADETHAIISNHLATASAALYKWSKISHDQDTKKAESLLGRILSNQSSEGWFREYHGADPGYQTLCLHYLAGLMESHPMPDLEQAIFKSLEFLEYFAYPDGSFGGQVGSRNTRFMYPFGLEFFASRHPAALRLAAFCRKGIPDYRHVGLSSMDESNLVPMLNSYCRAALVVEKSGMPQPDGPLPFQTEEHYSKHFPDSGILVCKTAEAYAVINSKKGGTVQLHKTDSTPSQYGGYLGCTSDGIYFSTQFYNSGSKCSISPQKITIESPLSKLKQELPTPSKFLVLRLLNVSAMRMTAFNRLIKYLLVKLLIDKPGKDYGTVTRTIDLKSWKVDDKYDGPLRLQTSPTSTVYNSIHMASQGYWQLGDS